MNLTKNQTSRPLVSFIIAYYELPVRLLRECVESILALSLRPSEREIIIVDDGSSNSPVSMLSDLTDQVLYLRQQHLGLSEARNTGLRMAQGTYIQFVDADDLLLTVPYEHCLDQIRFNKPEIVTFHLTDSKREVASFDATNSQTGAEYMHHHNIHGSACGYLFQRSILGDLRFTPGIWHEDEEFTPQLLLRAEHVCVTSAKAYYYRRQRESIMTSSHIRNRLKRLNDAKGIICRLNIIADRMPAEDRTALQRRIAQLTMDYLYNVILQTRSRHYLDRRIEELHRQGLFPLPDHDYTQKYVWFRRLSNSQKGRSLLMRLVPMLPQER